jgi:hypothetical protein
MSRTYGLKSARDLLAKLERDAALLREEVSSDRFFNFVVTAYSLADWIEKDPSVPASARSSLQQFRGTSEIQTCRDLANASKHFELDKKMSPSPTVATAESEEGFGVGRFGVGGYGVGEEEITVTLTAGNVINGLDVMENAVRAWKQFFSTHSI